MIILPHFHGIVNKIYTQGTFNPIDTSPSIWLDASTNNYLYTLDTGGSLVTNGNAVGRWEDRSGNGRHYIQPTTARRPIYRSAGQNSLGMVEFTAGSQHWLDGNSATLSTLNDANGVTAIIAIKYRELPTTYSNAVWFSRNSPADSSRFALGTGAAGTTQQHTIVRREDGGLTATNYITGSTSFQIHSSRINHTTALLDHYRDGVIINGNVATGLGTTKFSNTNSLRVSLGTHNISNFMSLDISEIFIWNRALTNTEISNMHTWILAKYIPA